VASAKERRFEITGGALCLDLANTVDNRPTLGRELLVDYADLVAWGQQAGALSQRQVRALSAAAERGPGRARAALARARSLRETLFRLFSRTTAGRSPDRADVGALDAALGVAAARRRLVDVGSRLELAWSPEAEGSLDLPTLAATLSAVELLTSPRLERVRICQARDCDWLFLDASRNGSRRWCDMSVCGNRAKVRRFRRRVRPAERRARPAQAAASRANACSSSRRATR
jgi:predicted RNA-binding Zn ribbon-like protein